MDEMMGIFRMRCDKGCYTLEPEAVVSRLAADGVKPSVTDRWTRYPVTPTLSVAAFQDRVAAVPLTAAETPATRLGVAVSGAVSGCVLRNRVRIWIGRYL